MADNDMHQLPENGFVRIFREDRSEDVDMPDVAALDDERLAEKGNEDARGNDQTSAASSEPRCPAELASRGPAVSKFIVAVDFGTTFSTVSFLRVDPGVQEDLIPPQEIRCIDHYPDKPPGIMPHVFEGITTVPSELWYPTARVSPTQNGGRGLQSQPAEEDEYSSALDEEGQPSSTPDTSDTQNDQPAIQHQGRPLRRSPVWGYGVHKRLAEPDDIVQKAKHVTRFKLLLDEENSTQSLREKAMMDLKALKHAGLVQKPVDTIADYLGQLFRHAKNQLVSSHGLQEGMAVEFVLCVPTLWTEQACRRMQEAMARAIETSQLGQLENGSVKDLFIVAEPEAAAAYALADNHYASRISPGETFLLLDCGGGTVDAITYKVLQTDPVRLKEVVPSDGASCGSSFLNDGFRELLENKLEGAEFLGNDLPLTRIIDSKVIEWENGPKREIDITNRKEIFDCMRIQGLQALQGDGGHPKGSLHFTRPEMKEVFKPCLRGVVKLMRKQLQQAKEARDEARGAGARGFNVQKVILIGGFGESPSLQNHLRDVLSKERNLLGQPIELIRPHSIDSAVARGAILRALNKENGPVRITRTSYGVLCTDLYDKESPLHQGLRGRRDLVDGELYIYDTIHWKILKGDVLPPSGTIRVNRRHTFKPSRARLTCWETLYVSGRRHESGYRKRHAENRGAEEAGRILVDLTSLIMRTENPIRPVTHRNSEGEAYTFYEIEFDLCLIIEGRNLRFEARSPEDPDKVNASTSFSIAASFVPGTA
ncbi:uncharacterized protein Z518_08732 [Rhinocladiella mackenziei CBS 650.93]|uniref:Hsp70 family chaperone n=1 Tax=Rhinocladiella mackenziei CBS 650.93 TaxID=1442369 RepID=A0A0D2J1L0_9EURO|nr:uncharacterized protein Z518_08732 [Rhinocladiella mackenziei CBS 650.93]KIX02790.1 hypothetical protein Z518_08732 [Rhinocladiella mackenziei CBS 650.93]